MIGITKILSSRTVRESDHHNSSWLQALVMKWKQSINCVLVFFFFFGSKVKYGRIWFKRVPASYVGLQMVTAKTCKGSNEPSVVALSTRSSINDFFYRFGIFKLGFGRFQIKLEFICFKVDIGSRNPDWPIKKS